MAVPPHPHGPTPIPTEVMTFFSSSFLLVSFFPENEDLSLGEDFILWVGGLSAQNFSAPLRKPEAPPPPQCPPTGKILSTPLV